MNRMKALTKSKYSFAIWYYVFYTALIVYITYHRFNDSEYPTVGINLGLWSGVTLIMIGFFRHAWKETQPAAVAELEKR